MKRYLFIILLSALFLGALYIYQSNKFSDKALHIVFCDVGQGDGIFIRTPTGTDIVIDGGPRNGKMVECLAQYMPFWDRDIELLFATHTDADHIGGLIEVLESYEVKSFNSSGATSDTATFRTLQNLIRENNIPSKVLVSGNKFTITDGVVLETLWPNPGFQHADTNEYSLVQVLRFGDFQALLTGDISYEYLNTLTFPDTYEVFKLPHHGSKTGLDDATFDKIRAYMAIISAGKNNRYHHPHPSIVSLLKRHNVPYERTDETGSIEVITDGRNTKVLN